MAREVNLVKCVIVLLCLTNSLSSKLNVARVLLPVFDDITTNFTLKSTDGNCLRWSTTREDVVKLTPVDYCEETNCSPQVIISPNTKERTRLQADIFAEDVITKQLLRCVVILDVINTLAITAKTREIILEEAPEVFEVRAYDIQGNEFSTLAGVPLLWFISPLGKVSDMPVIKLTSFKDSSYETPSSIVDLEEKGLYGDKVLLEGTKTGMSKVSVKLSQKEYENVKSNEIILSVVANLIILPSEVYIMVGDIVKFRVIQTNYGKTEEVNLKTSQYYLKVDNDNIASNEYEHGVIKGMSLGNTKLYLHDKNMGPHGDTDVQLPLPSASIHVVQPAYIIMHLLPYKNWITTITQRHEIVAEVYTEDDRKMTLGSDFHIQTTVGDAFHIQERSTNGSWQSGWTDVVGVAVVTAILDSITPPLKANGEIIIYSAIVLSPAEVILPWDPNTKPKYDVDLRASGGDGKFIWSSSNTSVGIVTQYGRVHTHNEGTFEVSAALQKNPHIRETAKFHILPPIKLEIVEFVMEAEVGTMIYLHIAIYVEKPGSKESQIPVTRCQDLSFKVRSTDPKFLYQKDAKTDAVGTACGTLAIISNDVGTGKVTVSYQSGTTTLQDSVTLTFFKPLKVLKPSGTMVLAVGSTTNIIFTGGPKARQRSQNVKVSTTGDEFVRIQDVTSKYKMPTDDEYTVIHALCLKLGDSNVTLSVINPPLIPNCRNQEASTTVTVICGKPRKLEIQPEIKVADASSCPMDLSSERIVVKSNEDVDLVIKVLDTEGREFLNVSSLSFQFESKPIDKAVIGCPQTVIEKAGVIGSAVYAERSYQKITPKIDTGEVVITASITGYDENVLRLNKIEPEEPAFTSPCDAPSQFAPIDASISLLLVDDTVVTPNEISVYNHPSNRIQLDVKQGSGFYSITMNKNDVVGITYYDNKRKLEISPLAKGDVTIKLVDLCLANKPAQINVNVVSINSIKAEMSDKVELGKCITCTLSLYDEAGNLMTVPNLDLIEISHKMDSNIATVERLVTPLTNVKSGEIQYVISGIELGDAHLIFYIGDPEFAGYVATCPLDLQVFPPLRVQPRLMVLAVGAVMQYNIKGGPQPSSDMEFTATNENTAICPHGIATGLSVGRTNVLAKSVGTTGSGQKIIYTEDTAELQVINLSGVKIVAPATKIKAGTQVPLWASGMPEQITPMILASIKTPIKYSWCVQDAHIARIYDILENSKVEVPSPNLPFVRLLGLKAGYTTVHLNATVTQNKKTIVYHSSLDIDIAEPLKLSSPIPLADNVIYMAPFSQTQLDSNCKCTDVEISYRLMGDSPSSTDIQHQSSACLSAVTVTKSGLVQTNVATGMSMIVGLSADKAGTKQSLIIPVEVRPVHYMMIALESKWKLEAINNEYVVPLGCSLDVVVTYSDSLGNPLIATGMDASLKTSRQDLTTIVRKSNNSYIVSTNKPGVTVLQISAEGYDKVIDYLKLNITQVITPFENELTVGDVLCFYTPVKMEEDGEWSSVDPTTFYIDSVTGIATALSIGRATIFHSFHPSAPVQVNILPIKNIQVVASNNTFTNTQEYKVHVTLDSAKTQRTNNFFSNYDCARRHGPIQPPISPITCSLKFDNSGISPDLFEVAPKFDAKLGKHYCSITPKAEAIQKGPTLPKSDASLTISTEKEDSVPSQQVKLSFVPGVQVPEDVTLDSNNFAGTLTIYGAPEALISLTVTAKDENVLYIGDRHVEGNKLSYTVQLRTLDNIEMYKDQLTIEVDAESSNQKLEVGVILEDGITDGTHMCGRMSEQTLLNVLHNNRVALSTCVGFILMLTLCTYAYLNYMQQQPPINVNVCPCPPTGPTQRSMTVMDTTPPQFETSCYCTRSPEIRRNRRYL